MSASAYQSYNDASKASESPREVEASLLIKAAQKLQFHKDNWNGMSDSLDDALLYNRKLWTIFSSSIGDKAHPLPNEVRENIANLAVFVFKHTLSVQARPTADKLSALININRQLAAGLQGSSADNQVSEKAIA